MRTLKAAIFVVAFVLLIPARAHAWWDWLDQLSGPGPFSGWDLQYRVFCFEDTDGPDIKLRNVPDSGRPLARFAGVGCVFDQDKNPLASLNITVGQFYTVKNDIQPDKTRDRVTMTRFEPSIGVFVDRKKIVEVQTGVGVLVVHGPAFKTFERFYWKPIQLNITPGAAHDARGLTFGIGVFIIPAGFDASNLGATGTFHTDKDVMTTASITWDFGRVVAKK